MSDASVCRRCGEPIAADDFTEAGTFVDNTAARTFAEHLECFMRGVVGSVGHQIKQCSCFGGATEDDPSMTTRQAARAAIDLYLATHGLPPFRVWARLRRERAERETSKP